MKRKLLSLFLTMVMASALTACGSAGTSEVSQDEDQDTVVSDAAASDSAEGVSEEAGDSGAANGLATDGKFVVGFDAEYPPYGYMDENGEYTGFDLELAEKVCEIEGWELVKTPIDWDSKDMELDSGAIDCIWNGFTIDGREDDYEWTDAYADNSQVIVTAEDSGINALSDLAGRTVGVQAASAALELLEGDQAELSATFSNLQEFADYNTAFVELQAGTVDAVAMDIGVANYQLTQRGEGFKIVEEELNSEQYGVGCKKGNTELRDIVNKDLHALAEDGTVAELAEKYQISDLICIE